MSVRDFHTSLSSPDNESVRSYTDTLPDEFREWALESDRISSRSDILDDFPQPPVRIKNLDAISEDGAFTPEPSVKNLRRNFTTNNLPLLQELNPYDGAEEFHPVSEECGSFDLIAPFDGVEAPLHKLERLSDVMFGAEHMVSILENPRYLTLFREFLIEERPRSISTLTYYLNAAKALKSIEYANTLVRMAVDVPPPAVQLIQDGHDSVGVTVNELLAKRVQDGIKALTAEELPAFITSRCITITSKIVEERVRGTLPLKFRDTSNALAEVFCLTDPSRPDNPIIFASEEFHRTTQYGMDYVLGRNCRFLQGPKTNPNSVRRLRDSIKERRHHSELFLNYRRDGSPFMNLLQCAPLCDSQGRVKYFIGAQVDVSGLVLEGAQMESLIDLKSRYRDPEEISVLEKADSKEKDAFRELCELFNPRELISVQDYGGDLYQPKDDRGSIRRTWARGSMDSEREAIRQRDLKSPALRGSLTGAYENYLLIRPYPSLRILFTSPSLQIPGMLQSSFLSRIGSPPAVVEELVEAIRQGRSVTACIKWVTRTNAEGRNRWIHCTPLYASNGEVGVWMVLVVDDEEEEQMIPWRT